MPDVPRPDEAIVQQLGDQLERARQFLLGNPEAAAIRAIEGIRDAEEAGARIAAQLHSPAPLASPDQLLPAHRLCIRALEVLDREGTRNAPVGRWGFLRPVVEAGVEYVAGYIVKGYTSDVVDSMARLYALREAQSLPGTPERRLLSQARIEATRLGNNFKGGGFGTPALIAGGLLVPAFAWLGDRIVGLDFTSRWVAIPGAVIFWLMAVLLSAICLRGAAVAHQRSRLIMREPLIALWGAVGHAGNPPEDDSTPFAIGAIVLTALAWLVIPGIAALVFLLD